MPANAVIEAFVAAVEAGRFVEAIETYYAPNASMRENEDAPRVGMTALVENEKRVLSIFPVIKARRTGPVMVSGDRVAINWAFDFERADGAKVRLEEIAWQRWSGDKIAEERFFYNPAQLQAAVPAAEVPAGG
ncbi:MAG TPA: nuclear transport factor 2 family protein [Caulobacteraceae bacterium]|nr:nuclear transport factor 2 family protein [Caulobacteraceae bacterium]